MFIQGYSNFSLETPACEPGSIVYRAHFTFDIDISSLFPYINAVSIKAEYYENPHYIKFMLDDFSCALYPDHGIAAKFESREQALASVDKLIDFLNSLYERRDSIEPNHIKYQTVSILEIIKLLPRINCKECGYTTCMAFAAALSKREVELPQCPRIKDAGDESYSQLQSILPMEK